MLVRAGVEAVVVDEASAAQLDEVLEGVETPLLLVLPEHTDVGPLARRWPRHRFVGADAVDDADLSSWTPTPADPDAAAYLLFTSGSTGVPKGVAVSHANVRHYLDYTLRRWRVTEQDRLSQTFDMTFDLSVNDQFLAYEAGACVCCPPAHLVSKPGKFIGESALTVWYAVPSVGLLMKRFGMLKPGAYPGLRLVLSCGEALPREFAEAWAAAAPNAVVENVYGPTEATITCSAYTWNPVRSPAECEQGIVPIGEMYPGMTGLVVDSTLREVEPGEVGELLLAGPQVTRGYWEDPEKTAAAFVEVPGRAGIHYRTGDLVRRGLPGSPMTYRGRVDNQVKVSGHRVELGEIEAVLREVSGRDAVVVVGWPRTETGFSAVSAFVQGGPLDEERIRSELGSRLPDYMVPRELIALESIPLNSNGKFDRPALVRMLEARA
jgi:amino acid adenylation domain-containing protein